jgi:hypothetical protein
LLVLLFNSYTLKIILTNSTIVFINARVSISFMTKILRRVYETIVAVEKE